MKCFFFFYFHWKKTYHICYCLKRLQTGPDTYYCIYTAFSSWSASIFPDFTVRLLTLPCSMFTVDFYFLNYCLRLPFCRDAKWWEHSNNGKWLHSIRALWMGCVQLCVPCMLLVSVKYRPILFILFPAQSPVLLYCVNPKWTCWLLFMSVPTWCYSVYSLHLNPLSLCTTSCTFRCRRLWALFIQTHKQ